LINETELKKRKAENTTLNTNVTKKSKNSSNVDL